MKKVIIASIFDIFFMPLGIVADTTITKHIVIEQGHDKYTGKRDSLAYIEYNNSSNAIQVNFNKPSNDVRVYIYKDGCIVFEDADQVQRGTVLNYSITDTEGGVYDAVVESDGRCITMDPVWIKE